LLISFFFNVVNAGCCRAPLYIYPRLFTANVVFISRRSIFLSDHPPIASSAAGSRLRASAATDRGPQAVWASSSSSCC